MVPARKSGGVRGIPALSPGVSADQIDSAHLEAAGANGLAPGKGGG